MEKKRKKSKAGKKKRKVISKTKTKKKRGKVGKKNEKIQKKRGKNIVDYCCNPQWFRCGGTVIPPHHLDIVN